MPGERGGPTRPPEVYVRVIWPRRASQGNGVISQQVTVSPAILGNCEQTVVTRKLCNRVREVDRETECRGRGRRRETECHTGHQLSLARELQVLIPLKMPSKAFQRLGLTNCPLPSIPLRKTLHARWGSLSVYFFPFRP